MNAGRAVTRSLPARVTAPVGTTTRKPLRSRKVALFCGSTWTLAVDWGGAALCCAALLHAACISRSTTIKTATSGSCGRRPTAFTAPATPHRGFPLAMDSPPLTAIGAVTRHISKQRLHWPRPAPQRYAQHERESTLCLWKLPFGISGWFDIPGGAARDPWGGFGQAPAHPPDPSAHGSRGAHCHRQFPAC